jgi:hypothetical protein
MKSAITPLTKPGVRKALGADSKHGQSQTVEAVISHPTAKMLGLSFLLLIGVTLTRHRSNCVSIASASKSDT